MPLASRLANIFTGPGEVFDAVKASRPSPTNWLVPAFLFIVLSWISSAIIFSQDSVKQQLNDLTDKGIEQRAAVRKLSPEDIDKARALSATIYKVGAVAGPVLTAFILPFWWGLLLWLAGKAMQGGFTFMKAVELAGLSNMILALNVVVTTPLIVLTGNLFAAPGLALLIKDYDPQNAAHALLMMANAMILWVLIVRSIGLARFCRVSFLKAAVWVFGMWLTVSMIALGAGQVLKALGKAAGGG